MQYAGNNLKRLPLSSSEIDAVKGFFMCLIVLGHITVFSQYFNTAFSVMYNFHVVSFLFLSFLLTSTTRTEHFIADRAIRYFVPYFVFTVGAGIIFYITFARSTTSFVQWLSSLLLALVFGSEELLDRASGLRIFWFIPALFSLVVLKYAFYNSSPAIKRGILIVAISVHLLIGIVPISAKQWIPLGLHIALFVFPVSLGISSFIKKLDSISRTKIAVAATALWIFCMAVGFYGKSYSAIAGGLRVYSVINPVNLLFHDIYAAAAFVSVLSLSHVLCRTMVLPLIGRNSFVIFLTHSVVWQVLLRSGIWTTAKSESVVGGALQTAFAFIMVICISLLIALIIGKAKWLSRVFFPRSWQEWPLKA